jgi:hypothetical protein
MSPVGVALFEVPFATAMTALDLARLTLELDLSAPPRSPASSDDAHLAYARLDHFSGLFLKRSVADGQWVLQARTWGHPAAAAVHGWHVRSAQAARQLDPMVSLPDRLPDDSPAVADLRVEPGANTRVARMRRRLVGLR